MEDGPRRVTSAHRVAVIGAGWAGCAAAVRLAQAGMRVLLFEQARDPGGRARTVDVGGVELDNGQHLLIGAYRSTLDLMRLVHDGEIAELLHDLPLTLRPFGTCNAPTFVASSVRAPWHFIGALLGARGFTLMDRIALARAVQVIARGASAAPDDTVQMRYATLPRAVYRAIFEPLCMAALNTPPARASAAIFENVLRAALCGPEPTSRFLVPKVRLSALLPQHAIAFVARHDGEVHLGQRVRAVRIDGDAVHIATTVRVEHCDAVVIAVGPHQLAHVDVQAPGDAWNAILERVAKLSYESINTIHLGYTQATMRAPIERLDDAPGQWIFDGGDIDVAGERLRLLSVVISASGPHDAWPQDELVRTSDAQLRRLSRSLGALRFSRVLAERRATYACVPQLERPTAGRIAPRLHLAGDYTHGDYPATLEAAVQTGEAAARTVLTELTRDIATLTALQA